MRPVQPGRDVLLGDLELFGNLCARPLFEVAQPYNLTECRRQMVDRFGTVDSSRVWGGRGCEPTTRATVARQRGPPESANGPQELTPPLAKTEKP